MAGLFYIFRTVFGNDMWLVDAHINSEILGSDILAEFGYQ